MIDLLSCPFCGGRPELCDPFKGNKDVSCVDCKASPGSRNTVQGAITAWNARISAVVRMAPIYSIRACFGEGDNKREFEISGPDIEEVRQTFDQRAGKAKMATPSTSKQEDAE